MKSINSQGQRNSVTFPRKKMHNKSRRLSTLILAITLAFFSANAEVKASGQAVVNLTPDGMAIPLEQPVTLAQVSAVPSPSPVQTGGNQPAGMAEAPRVRVTGSNIPTAGEAGPNPVQN